VEWAVATANGRARAVVSAGPTYACLGLLQRDSRPRLHVFDCLTSAQRPASTRQQLHVFHFCTATRVPHPGNLDILRYNLEYYTSIFYVLSFPLEC
jgi:hypothetical protein